MKNILMMIAICSCLTACGGGDEATAPPVAGAESAALSPPDRSSNAAFTATVSGAVDRAVEGSSAVSGAKYSRYHINMASQRQADGPPMVVIAFGRTDTGSPAAGRYFLGASDGFSGSLEIYGEPQREFQITGGELVIADARGDVLSGSFSFTAREAGEEYGEWEDVEVEGSFSSQPVS
jgi:hypothetical protein